MPLTFLVFDYHNAAEKLRKQVDKLSGLTYDNMGKLLYGYGVITFIEREKINKKDNNEKMEYLIVDVIIRSLRQGFSRKYKLFLKAMEESDDPDLNSRAKCLGKLIHKLY